MKDKIEARLAKLEKDHAIGTQKVAAMRQELAQTEQTVLHIEGAIAVCRELLQPEPPPEAEPADVAARRNGSPVPEPDAQENGR